MKMRSRKRSFHAPEPGTALLALLALAGLALGRRRNRARSLVVMLALTACLSLSVNTATAATVDAFVGAPNNPATTRTDTFAQAGIGFYATAPFTTKINRLGFWVSPDNPGGVLARDHEVALYSRPGGVYTQVASATVLAGSTADANGYAWASIPELTLDNTNQGADWYILMAGVGTDIWAPFTGNANVPTLNPAYGTRTNNGWFSTTAAPGNGNVFSDFNLAANNGGYFGPNIGFAPPPAPEPSTALLALLALAGLALGRRARLRR